MQKLTIAFLLVAGLAACEGQRDLNRATGGALAGAFVAEATGNDPLTGAAVGAAAGALTDDVTGR